MNKKILEIRPEKLNNVPKGDEKIEYGVSLVAQW